jgi:hypothetical protein
MSPIRRSLLASALVALAISVFAGLGYRYILVSTAAAAQRSAGALFAEALPLGGFLADGEHSGRWRAQYDGSEAAVTELLPRVAALPGRWYLLVVAEEWCTDAVNTVPHLARLADQAGNLDLRLIGKSQGQHLLDAHPVEGRGRIPLVLVLDESLTERAAWIERPAALRERVAALRADPSADTGAEVRAWYAADAGRSALGEILALLEQTATGRSAARLPDPDAEYTPIRCDMPE